MFLLSEGRQITNPFVRQMFGVGQRELETYCYDCAWLSLTALSTVTCNLWL
jgi:hypothetical protein